MNPLIGIFAIFKWNLKFKFTFSQYLNWFEQTVQRMRSSVKRSIKFMFRSECNIDFCNPSSSSRRQPFLFTPIFPFVFFFVYLHATLFIIKSRAEKKVHFHFTFHPFPLHFFSSIGRTITSHTIRYSRCGPGSYQSVEQLQTVREEQKWKTKKIREVRHLMLNIRLRLRPQFPSLKHVVYYMVTRQTAVIAILKRWICHFQMNNRSGIDSAWRMCYQTWRKNTRKRICFKKMWNRSKWRRNRNAAAESFENALSQESHWLATE